MTSKNAMNPVEYRILKQLIEAPKSVTGSSSTIIDHILASSPNRVSQQGVIDVGTSDHQIIYCTINRYAQAN